MVPEEIIHKKEKHQERLKKLDKNIMAIASTSHPAIENQCLNI
jgi:hypothetical protein